MIEHPGSPLGLRRSFGGAHASAAGSADYAAASAACCLNFSASAGLPTAPIT